MIVDNHSVAFNIQFYDPKQLMDSVNTTVSIPYFNLCQIFLNKSTELCLKHYKLNSSDITTVQSFNEHGATLSMSTDTPNAVPCLMMISVFSQLLSEVLYKRYREEKRFVLQTRCSIQPQSMQCSCLQIKLLSVWPTVIGQRKCHTFK